MTFKAHKTGDEKKN